MSKDKQKNERTPLPSPVASPASPATSGASPATSGASPATSGASPSASPASPSLSPADLAAAFASLGAADMAAFVATAQKAAAEKAAAEKAAAEKGIPEAVKAALSAFPVYGDLLVTVSVADGKWACTCGPRPFAPPVLTKRGRTTTPQSGEPQRRYPSFDAEGKVVGHIPMSETAIRARRLTAEGKSLKEVARLTQPDSPENLGQCAQNIGTKPIQDAIAQGILDPVTLARL